MTVSTKMQTSEKWLEELYPHAKVIDPDGWNRKDLQYSFYEEKISEMEFQKRFVESTVSMRLLKVGKDISNE